jgi:hypothetical protein
MRAIIVAATILAAITTPASADTLPDTPSARLGRALMQFNLEEQAYRERAREVENKRRIGASSTMMSWVIRYMAGLTPRIG